MRIEERLRESAARMGAGPAVIAGRARHSYAELGLKSLRLAAALASGGVARGERVIVFMDDGWEAVVSFFAVLKAGGVVVPVATAAAAGQLGETLRRTQPVAVITQSRLAAMVAAEIAQVWSVKLIVLAGGDRARTAGTCISFEEIVERIGQLAALPASGSESDPAVLLAGDALTHCQIAEDATATAAPADGVMVPALGERAGLALLLAAVEAGRTMTAQSLFAREDERRTVRRRAAEAPFGIGQRLDPVASAAPAFH
jgi:long-chain acyl-CoA synthetase